MGFLAVVLWPALIFFVLIYLSYYCLMRYESGKNERTTGSERLRDICVIIPAYNEERFILRCLESVKNLDYPKDRMGIIVVDDGSTDNTSSLVDDYFKTNSHRLNARLIVQSPRGGKALAINQALTDCNSEIVLLTDADTLLREDAMKEIVKNFDDPSVGAVTGRLSMINFNESSATKLEKIYRGVFDILRKGESRLDSTPIFNGPLVAVRRELLENLEADTIADDTEIAIRTREKGYRAIFDPQALVYANTPTGFAQRLRQKTRRGVGIIQSFMRHRDMIFNPKYKIYGFVILPVEIFMHIISPILTMIFVALASLTVILNSTAVLRSSTFILTVLTLMFASLLVLTTKIRRAQKMAASLLSLFSTFLEHQLALFLSLLRLLTRSENPEWQKIS